MDDLLLGLTDAQREAVLHIDGPLLILAGPGSGKTRVITHRIAHMLQQGVSSREVVALTFTNKAADEMRSRIGRLSPGQPVWISTFHRFCARLLRQHASLVGLAENYTIYDTDDSLRALKRALAIEKIDLTPYSPGQVTSAISWAKNNLIGPDQYHARPGHAVGTLVARAYPAYQSQLRQSNAVDFDDLLLYVALMLRENPEFRAQLDQRYRYVLVDEYQDTNLAQYAIVRGLSIDQPNLAVTGDPDQSIYGWRGANLHNILEFEKDFPSVHVVRLERNYRSTQRILQVADELIRHNIKRKQKELYTENGEGTPVTLVKYPTEKDEADQIAAQIADQIRRGQHRPRDFAIFYRVNALSRAFEFALRDAGVPYQLIQGVEFFQRKEIKDILGYLQLLNNPRDAGALARIINVPARGIGKTALDRLSQFAVRQGISLLEAARRAREIEVFPARSASQVEKFVALYDHLATALDSSVEEVVGLVLSETGYQASLKQSQAEEDQERLANIEELLTVARQFDEHTGGEGRLEDFLEQASLVNDTDDLDGGGDRVTLMTLHASKGLEFPVVFLVAVEQGLLPHERSRQDPDQLEEERRLMFVGITRAQQELQISLAGYRDFRGQRKTTIPSPFLMELPRSAMNVRNFGSTFAGIDDYVDYDLEMDRPPRAAAPNSLPTVLAPLQTAAELAQGGPQNPISPDLFHQGMLVRHPQYGLGRVVALAGSGPGRKATVDFASSAGRMRFVLDKSPLRPVR